MGKQKRTYAYYRLITEIPALLAVIILTSQQKLQMWLGVFLLGVIISLRFGRFFCGWICPMNTLFRPIDWIYRKLHIRRLKTPAFLSKTWVRYAFLALFVIAMVSMRIFQIKINVLLYVIILSVIVTLFFEESFWHRHVCPFGTILSISSRSAKTVVDIDKEGCISCGICQKECPSDAIITAEDGKREIIHHECLMCYECIECCPKDACSVQRS